MIVSVLLGALCWSFLEYVIHRWMGHDRRFRRTPFGAEHTRHHIEGDYFAPTWKKALVATAVAALVCGTVVAFAGTHGVSFVVGLMGFYGFYEVLHRLEHTYAGVGPYGRWARTHHFHHHFVDGRTNHGVTSPLWDFVFRTYRKPGVIRVPRRLCMRWLADERNLRKYADVFVVSP